MNWVNWLLGFVLIVLLALAFGAEEALKGLLTVVGLALLAIGGVIALVFVLLWNLDKATKVSAPDLEAPLLERSMQEILAVYPGDLLGEQLTLKGKEVPLGRRSLDLLFEDARGALVGVELKRDSASDADVTQVIRYRKLLKSKFRGRRIRMVLVAPEVPGDRKSLLKAAGVDWNEIPEERFRKVASDRGFKRA